MSVSMLCGERVQDDNLKGWDNGPDYSPEALIVGPQVPCASHPSFFKILC